MVPMFTVTYFSAFFGGLLTFFAPCTLPLIPAFIAFISGHSPEKTGDSGTVIHKKIFLSALLFVFGFTTVFMFFGLVSGSVGASLVVHKKLIAQIGGVVVIFLGLGMLRIIHLPRLALFQNFTLPRFITPGSKRGGFLLGLLFALGWSPCLGPVLGTILVLAGATGSMISGATLLFMYALGLGLPFLFVALLYGSAVGYVTALQKYLPIISRLGGVLVVIMGFLLLFGQFGSIGSVLFDPYAVPSLRHLMDSM
jgi:cytochrome c-type biogenesis protein